VPQLALRATVAADSRSVFNSQDLVHAEGRLVELVVKYEKSAPALSDWMERSIPGGLTVMRCEESQRRRLRTSNMCENLNRQIKRRTRVAGLFPNEKSVLRLVTAILIETSEEWETGKAYLTLTAQNQITNTPNHKNTAA
jgi:putative transposase